MEQASRYGMRGIGEVPVNGCTLRCRRRTPHRLVVRSSPKVHDATLQRGGKTHLRRAVQCPSLGIFGILLHRQWLHIAAMHLTSHPTV